jgi:RNA polymerase sigma-70 factor (ECF subfamily)
MLLTDEASALFKTYHDPIYRYALTLVRNAAEAEDLTQDTFLRAYAHQESLRDPNAVRGWLYRIATRACVDRFRRRPAEVSLDDNEGAESVKDMSSPSPSALQVALRDETGACVQRCLEFLSDRYRAVLLLYEGHGLTVPEIAAVLGESVGTVKIRLHRARRKLQEIMQIGCAVSESTDGLPLCQPKLRAETRH